MKSVILITAMIGVSLAQQYRVPSPQGDGNPPTVYSGPAPQGYGQQPATQPQPPTYGSGPSPSPYGVAHRRAPQRTADQISAGLEFVAERLGVLETSDDAQTRRVDVLAASARDNFDLANNFNAYLYNEITREQDKQNARLQALEARLNEIRELRNQVNQLNEAADTLRDRVQIVELEELKYFQYEINDLQNADLALQVRISEIQVRADAITQQIDMAFETAAFNTVSLDILEINVRRVIDSVNRQVGASGFARLSPNGVEGLSPDATIPFPVAANSIPQAVISSIVGFRIRRGHSYGHEYPSIYFMAGQDPSNDRVVLSSMDTSTGGWSVDVLELDFDAVYYDNAQYAKSLLDLDWQ